MKLKETFRSLYTILTKEKGFGLQGMGNCGEVTSNYMGKLMENPGYFGKVSTGKLILVSTPACLPP